MDFKVRHRDDPRVHARVIIEALPNGQVQGTAYGRAGDVLREIDVLVRAAVPDVKSASIPYHGEHLGLWSLDELEGVAFFPLQKPEEGVAYFPQGELGGDAYWVPDGT
jgi:hypothetical protein